MYFAIFSPLTSPNSLQLPLHGFYFVSKLPPFCLRSCVNILAWTFQIKLLARNSFSQLCFPSSNLAFLFFIPMVSSRCRWSWRRWDAVLEGHWFCFAVSVPAAQSSWFKSFWMNERTSGQYTCTSFLSFIMFNHILSDFAVITSKYSLIYFYIVHTLNIVRFHLIRAL